MSRRAAEILPENHITTNGFVPASQPLRDINNTKACPNTSKNSSTTNYNKNNPSAMSFHANKMALHQQNTVAKLCKVTELASILFTLLLACHGTKTHILKQPVNQSR